MKKRKSALTRSERIESAFEYFGRGYTNSDVAKKLKIHRNTACNYRALYERSIQTAKLDNPGFLQDVLGNTLRLSNELEQIRRDAWKDHDKAERRFTVTCDNCDEEVEVSIADMELRNKIRSNMIKAQSERAKLFGVIGVKAEVLGQVAQVKAVQDKILEFLRIELCPEDRRKLDTYFNSPAMLPFMGAPVDVESWEEASA